MTNYEKLLSECSLLNISVHELDLKTDKPCGKCLGNNIYINNNCNDDDKYCILLEELGHYLTTYGDITDKTNISNIKQELWARKWGYNHSVTLYKIVDAFEYGARDKYELASYLGVTDEYLDECIENLKKKYGVGQKVNEYYIAFEPHFGIYKTFYPV